MFYGFFGDTLDFCFGFLHSIWASKPFSAPSFHEINQYATHWQYLFRSLPLQGLDADIHFHGLRVDGTKKSDKKSELLH